MGKSKKAIVGYKYFIGMHAVFCHGPIDKLLKIVVGDRDAWSGSSSGGQINVNAPGLFGGEKREGGVSGKVDFEPGDADQQKNSYLSSKAGGRVSANRGVSGVVLRQCYIGNNPYIKPWHYLVQRIHRTRRTGEAQWYDAKAQIGQGMNPAHIIRECLTDTEWGMGYNSGDIGNSFQSAADTLYSENFGMSLLWDRAITIEEFLNEVIQTIDGSLYVDITTGKFELSLARDDYDPGNLPVLDESNIISVQQVKRKSSAELVNSVTLKFWNQNTYATDSVQVHDIALIGMMGAQVGTTITYDGITDPALASVIATRELRALSRKLASVTLITTRAISGLQIGGVFAFTWPRLGIERMILRVIEIEYGNLTDGSIKIKTVEDIFSTPVPMTASSEPTEWVSPNTMPVPVPHQYMYEATYYDIITEFGDEFVNQLDKNTSAAMIVADAPSDDSYGATVHSKITGEYEEADTITFAPYAELDGAIGYQNTSVNIKNARRTGEVAVGTYAFIGDEVVRIDTVSATQITVGRGCLDTVPAPHDNGTLVIFAEQDTGTDGEAYQVSETAKYKLTPYTSMGELGINQATELSVTMVGRPSLPYPPGRVRIGGSAYPASRSGSFTVTWAVRNRVIQSSVLVDTEEVDAATPANYRVTLEFRRADNDALLISRDDIDPEISVTCQLNYAGDVVMILGAKDNNGDSFQRHEITFSYSGGGTDSITGASYTPIDDSTIIDGGDLD